MIYNYNNMDLIKKMVEDNKNIVDNTNDIRLFKNSRLIKEEINKLLELRKKILDPDELKLESMVECNYLAENHTDLYNRIRKNEINMDILWRAIDVLEQIEEGVMDKYQGSVEFGTLLREIYIDSALKKIEKLEKEHPELAEYKKPEKSWKDYRKK